MDYNFKKKGRNLKIYDCKIIKPEVIEIGNNSEIDDFVFIYGGKGIKIGKYVHISRFVSIIGGGELILGDYVVLADGVRILTGTDRHNKKWGKIYSTGSRMSTCAPEYQRNPFISKVEIGKDAFIGTNSIVHPGVKIGEGAIVGSNSLVLHNLKAWGIYVGSPCKLIKTRMRVKYE